MSSARIIDGRQIARDLRSRVAADVAAFTSSTGVVPGLATLLIGEDPASEVYVRNKRTAVVAAGMADLHHHLDASVSQSAIASLIAQLRADDSVSGILLQLPLPESFDSAALIDLIPAQKDVDGLTTLSAGLLARGVAGLRPCTPTGVMTLNDSTGLELDGANAVDVGRSELVGGPMSRLLLERNATVTVAHSHTRDLESITSQADVLVVAAGKPGLIGARHVKQGAVVIDVGIHRTTKGLIGDVRFEEVLDRASWITPVPGGVGPMTIAVLMANTLSAARVQAGLPT